MTPMIRNLMAAALMLAPISDAVAEDFTLPPPECLDPSLNQLYSVEPPWFSWTDKIESAYFNAFHTAAVRDLSNMLERHGKRLVVVPYIPPSTFAPKVSAGGKPFDAREVARQSRELVAYYQENGVETIDLTPATENLPTGVFFQRRVDHHWTAEGAARSAQLVASHVSDAVFEPVPSWFETLSALPVTTYEYYPSMMRTLLPETCNSEEYAIEDKSYTFPARVAATEATEEALFGDTAARRIAVLGSSYTAADSGWVFPRAIEYYSGTPVIDYSFGGGGAATPLRVFLEDGMHLDPTIDTLIWIPEKVNKPEQTVGAALLGAGMIKGSCSPEALFYARRDVATEYATWIDVPEVIGLVDRLDIFANQNERLEFKITTTEHPDGILANIFFGAGYNRAEPYMWSIKLPVASLLEQSGERITGVQMRLTGFREYSPEGPVEFSIASCASL